MFLFLLFFYYYFYFYLLIILFVFFEKKKSLCQIFAKAKFLYGSENFAIPTVLPPDFVSLITFSSKLRFKRFGYRWKDYRV